MFINIKISRLLVSISTAMLLALNLPVLSQSINGDTIYVNSKVEVAIQFPSLPSNFYMNPVDAPYYVRSVGNGVTILAKSKNTLPATLSLTEGKRKHSFYILYKKNIDIFNKEETYFDYSTTKILEEHIKKKEAANNSKEKYAAFTSSAKSKYDQKRYSEAKADYEEILKLKPKDKNAISQLKKIDKLLKEVDGTNNDKKAKKSKKQKVENNQANSGDDLNTKYPDIDFSAPPPDQKFDVSDFGGKKSASIAAEILAENPRLNIDDDSRKVKIVCQGLSFKNKAVYLKVLVQNKSKTDFLAGAMLITWKKKSEKPVELLPVFLFPEQSPVIKAGNEAYILYIFKPVNIADSDVLNFELKDRLNKIKLDVNIKGSVYTEESIRMF